MEENSTTQVRSRARVSSNTAAAALLLALLSASDRAAAWNFEESSLAAGVAYTHDYVSPTFEDQRHVAGGVGIGDYDRDGWLDVYAVSGDVGSNFLFRNLGDGTFEEIASEAGVDLLGHKSSGPIFADYDGDGWLDLLVLGVNASHPVLFRNLANGSFMDVTAAAGLTFTKSSLSAAFGDYDLDGDLDLVVCHWKTPATSSEILWRNEGDGTFTDVTAGAGFVVRESFLFPGIDLTFAPTFADIDDDGFPEILITSDFATSQVLHNNGDGTFTDVTSPVITDENGMGSAVADYDHDGDLDWFVTSIWDPDDIYGFGVGDTGNRFYQNQGDGSFADVTDATGTRVGFWGWAATLADLDNSGHLDIFHVNGFGPVTAPAFFTMDPARLFVANGDGTFSERSEDLGVDDIGQGRGTAAFDYDRDGDLDLFVMNNEQPSRFFRNDGGNKEGHWIGLELVAPGPNTQALGARIHLTAGGTTQMREVHAGSNYVSSDPAEVHFGLGDAKAADELRVVWPGGEETVLTNVDADRAAILFPPDGATACTEASPTNPCSPGGKSSSRSECLIEWQVAPTPPAGGDGLPGRKIDCVEGDPSCDLDANASDHDCEFEVTLCINNQDPRLGSCQPDGLSELAIRSPRSPSPFPADVVVRDALDEVVGEGFRLLETSPVGNLTPNLCGDPVAVRVPLRELASGKLKPGKMKLTARGKTSDRRSDSDTMLFKCRPPA